jgi:hypothetical protein
MSAAIWFWLIWVFSLLFGGFWYWRTPGSQPFGPYALVFYILTGLLGWGVFGQPIR